jgi:hypothetical protein
MEEMTKIGKDNSLLYHVDELGILRIQIDTNKELGPSASGKTMLIASSAGNAKINISTETNGDREAFLGLNLYYK